MMYIYVYICISIFISVYVYIYIYMYIYIYIYIYIYMMFIYVYLCVYMCICMLNVWRGTGPTSEMRASFLSNLSALTNCAQSIPASPGALPLSAQSGPAPPYQARLDAQHVRLGRRRREIQHKPEGIPVPPKHVAGRRECVTVRARARITECVRLRAIVCVPCGSNWCGAVGGPLLLRACIYSYI